MTHHFRAAGAQRFAAQAAGLSVNFLEANIVRRRARDSGVRRHDAGDVPWPDEFQDFIQRLKGQVGRHFHQDGFARNVQLLHRGKNLIQRRLVLQLPEIRRVRRTDVHHKKIREVAQRVEGTGVIARRFVQRRDLGFAEVDADGMVRPASGFFPLGKFFRHRLCAGIIETHAVDDGFVGDRAEHPGRRIAGLRVPRHAAEFREAEAERGPAGNGRRVFIHARREADRVRKFQTEHFRWQRRRAENFFNTAEQQLIAAHQTELADDGVVSAFGILPEEQGTENFFMDETHEAASLISARLRGNVLIIGQCRSR